MTGLNKYNPKISIIMNCHNCEKYLDIALNSVFSQTYHNWEIIFWDNNSTDNSSLITQKFKNKLFYYKSKTLLKLGTARRKAVNKASGDLLAFLDCDDVWLKNKLKLQVNEFKTHKASLIYSRAEIINESGKVIGLMPDNSKFKSGYIFKDLAKENFIPFVSVIMKRSTYYNVGGFPENYVNSTDYFLFLNVSLKNKIMFLPEVTCQYREHTQNLSKYNIIRSVEEDIITLKNLLPNKDIQNALSIKYTNLSIAYLKKFNLLNAIYYFIFFSNKTYFFERSLTKFLKYIKKFK